MPAWVTLRTEQRRGKTVAPFNAVVSIWGQSNAVGRALRADISATPLSSDPELATFDAGTFSRVWIWDGTAYQQLQPSVFNGPNVSPGQFGPEFGLAVRWTRETTGGNLYLDKIAEGGESITAFAPPSSFYYSWGSTENTQRLAWFTTNAVTIQKTALLWIQGEQDAAQTQSWYETRLSDLIASMRTDGIIQANSLAVLSQMPIGGGATGAGVTAAKTAYAAASGGLAVTLQMPDYLGDSVHLNARGQVQHGYDAYRSFFGGAQINV